MTMVSAQFPVSLRDEIARNAQAYDRSLSQPCARRRGSTWRRLFNEGPPPPRKPRTCHDGSRRRPRERCGRPCGRPPGERRMTYLIATSTFLDPTDNQPVIAGATVVAPEAAVVRLHPERFRPIERGNLGMPGGGLERVGGVTGFQPGGDQASPPGRRPGSRGRGLAVRPVPAPSRRRLDRGGSRHPLDRTIRHPRRGLSERSLGGDGGGSQRGLSAPCTCSVIGTHTQSPARSCPACRTRKPGRARWIRSPGTPTSRCWSRPPRSWVG